MSTPQASLLRPYCRSGDLAVLFGGRDLILPSFDCDLTASGRLSRSLAMALLTFTLQHAVPYLTDNVSDRAHQSPLTRDTRGLRNWLRVELTRRVPTGRFATNLHYQIQRLPPVSLKEGRNAKFPDDKTFTGPRYITNIIQRCYYRPAEQKHNTQGRLERFTELKTEGAREPSPRSRKHRNEILTYSATILAR
jgi:hypothetical protein